MTQKHTYSPRESTRPYRTVRFTLSRELLIEVAREYEIDQGRDIEELAKEALIDRMESEGYIQSEVQ